MSSTFQPAAEQPRHDDPSPAFKTSLYRSGGEYFCHITCIIMAFLIITTAIRALCVYVLYYGIYQTGNAALGGARVSETAFRCLLQGASTIHVHGRQMIYTPLQTMQAAAIHCFTVNEYLFVQSFLSCTHLHKAPCAGGGPAEREKSVCNAG